MERQTCPPAGPLRKPEIVITTVVADVGETATDVIGRPVTTQFPLWVVGVMSVKLGATLVELVLTQTCGPIGTSLPSELVVT
jgi:hypothetical protein